MYLLWKRYIETHRLTCAIFTFLCYAHLIFMTFFLNSNAVLSSTLISFLDFFQKPNSFKRKYIQGEIRKCIFRTSVLQDNAGGPSKRSAGGTRESNTQTQDWFYFKNILLIQQLHINIKIYIIQVYKKHTHTHTKQNKPKIGFYFYGTSVCFLFLILKVDWEWQKELHVLKGPNTTVRVL